jgi:hypothetical protein
MIGLQVPEHVLRLGLLFKRADKGVRRLIEHGGHIERTQLRNPFAKRYVGIGGKAHHPAAAIQMPSDASNTHKLYWIAATIFLVGHLPPQAAKMPPLTLDLPGQQ